MDKKRLCCVCLCHTTHQQRVPGPSKMGDCKPKRRPTLLFLGVCVSFGSRHCLLLTQAISRLQLDGLHLQDLLLVPGTRLLPGFNFVDPPKTDEGMNHLVAQKRWYPKWVALASGNMGPKPAVCPSCLILSHSHLHNHCRSCAVAFFRTGCLGKPSKRLVTVTCRKRRAPSGLWER